MKQSHIIINNENPKDIKIDSRFDVDYKVWRVNVKLKKRKLK